MSADQSRPERQEIPFRAGCLQHFFRINADTFENHRQFVHQRNIDVALRIFDDFGGLCNLDTGCLVRSRSNNRCVDAVNEITRFRSRPGGHFQY